MEIITESISKDFLRSYMKVVTTVAGTEKMLDEMVAVRRVMVMPLTKTGTQEAAQTAGGEKEFTFTKLT